MTVISRRTAVAALAATPILTRSRAAFAQSRIDDVHVMVRGLGFTEAPVAMKDGSVVFVDIPNNRLHRVSADGKLEILEQWNDGPNGVSIGPDGGCYVARRGNRGGPPRNPPPTDPVIHGSLSRVDLATKEVKVIYRQADGQDLGQLDDLVFDEWGDVWITDLSGGLYWARTDGTAIRKIADNLVRPNGIGLSPDHRTLYVSLTDSRQLLAYPITGRGTAGPMRVLSTLDHKDMHYDSLAVEADGSVLVCAVGEGFARFAPDGKLLEMIAIKDFWPVNMSFGGPDMRTLYASGYPAGQKPGTQDGQVVSMRWPRPGLKMLYRQYA